MSADPSGSTPGSAAWRAEQLQSVLRFAEHSALPSGGFGWLDGSGRVDPSHDLELWINARMTYVFALASLRDRRAHPLAEHGVSALRELFADPVHGGWFPALDSTYAPVATTKACYEHSFVLLAGSAATVAGIDGADRLLTDALAVHERRFWDADAGRCREAFNTDWSMAEPYRGANSNMHTVEAYLFAADATGNPVWHERALSICERIINDASRTNGWRIPEHYDDQWRIDLEYNASAPADKFRPYGATPGHGFEWSRLLVTLEAALDDPPAWMLDTATALFTTASRDGGLADGTLCYTTDWNGVPVVRERFHWVLAEAVAAADALARRTDGAVGAEDAQTWWNVIDRHFVDRTSGSWHHELDEQLEVSSRTWDGKPDAYHIVNAMVLPDAPLSPPLARSLSRPAG